MIIKGMDKKTARKTGRKKNMYRIYYFLFPFDIDLCLLMCLKFTKFIGIRIKMFFQFIFLAASIEPYYFSNDS